jgi:DNA recombination protein RmuC
MILEILLTSSFAMLCLLLWQQRQLHKNISTTITQSLENHPGLLKVANQINQLDQAQQNIFKQLLDWLTQQQSQSQSQQSRWDEHIQQSLHRLQQHLSQTLQLQGQNLKSNLEEQSKKVERQLQQLNQTTESRLQQISGQVEKRLHDGFEKTTEIFQNVILRLAKIDEAQKRISELSTHVVDLQSLLNDKRARGAFGEVQLAQILHNMIPERYVSLQHTLSNGCRVDCLLKLPEPTGHISIDAKFPLETYQKMQEHTKDSREYKSLYQQFQLDIKQHIKTIASKYILAEETADGAMMFIPAEAIFAEIHNHHPKLIQYAQKLKVWLVSPSTMMAILTTASAVLKDVATRKQVHLIQQHLSLLHQDFQRFGKRMDMLAKHIEQAHTDVNDVHISSKKIVNHFTKIERVELQEPTALESTSELQS